MRTLTEHGAKCVQKTDVNKRILVAFIILALRPQPSCWSSASLSTCRGGQPNGRHDGSKGISTKAGKGNGKNFDSCTAVGCHETIRKASLLSKISFGPKTFV